MMGKKVRKRERETERERDLGREGEQHSSRRKQREVDFDNWSKSTTPANLNNT